ncbi:hypothetical protein Tco_0683361 [Tanacetum coccineum]|uniref:Transposase n=1 Tax=Tanacetum coccineum TaxID=301880 RepID=A0ABQ4XUN1_9ASTR
MKPPRNNQNQQQTQRDKNTGRAYAAGNDCDRRHTKGPRLLCSNDNITMMVLGHFKKDCLKRKYNTNRVIAGNAKAPGQRELNKLTVKYANTPNDRWNYSTNALGSIFIQRSILVRVSPVEGFEKNEEDIPKMHSGLDYGHYDIPCHVFCWADDAVKINPDAVSSL